jgi:O-antigen/teichoic acid export membrane protein
VADLYWRTAVWVAVFSFPMLALTTVMAEPVTVFLYEPRYQQSAVYLAIVSVGFYLNAALGFNGLTLRVYGFIRYTLFVNLATVVVYIGLALVLIRELGALGAALSSATALVFHNALKQWGLRRRTTIDVFDRAYLRVYLLLLAGIAVLAVVQVLLHPNLVVGMLVAGLVSIGIVVANRRRLDLGGTFPELRRVPLLRHLVGGRE